MESSRSAVHVLWDIESLSLSDAAHSHSVSLACRRLHDFAAQHGAIDSLHCIAHSGSLSPDLKRQLHENGMEIEEFVSSKVKSQAADVFIVTRMLKLAINAMAQATSPAVHSRPSLILVSDDRDLAAALSIVRRSGLFNDTLLVHTDNASQSLISAANVAVRWDAIVTSSAGVTSLTRAVSLSQSISRASSSASSPASLTHTQKTDTESEVGDALNTSDCYREGQPGQSRDDNEKFDSPLPSKPSPSEMRTARSSSLSAKSAAFEPIGEIPSLYTSIEGEGVINTGSVETVDYSMIQPASVWDTVTNASNEAVYNNNNKQSNNYKNTNEFSRTMPTLGRSYGSGGSGGKHRYQTPSNHQPFRHSATDRFSPRHRTFLTVFHRVLAYCEAEKIIPRESVVKKRLLDSKLSIDVDFEEFLAVVSESGAAVVEGDPPQRVIWPRGPDGEVRKFPCADFFQPSQRLSDEQTQELVLFLSQYQPTVDRGRFGFAQWLARNGPDFIQALPHGVLVELVQLLLNQKVLLFRKGKVSVSPTLGSDHSHVSAMDFYDIGVNANIEGQSSNNGWPSQSQHNNAHYRPQSNSRCAVNDSHEDNFDGVYDSASNYHRSGSKGKDSVKDRINKNKTWSHPNAFAMGVHGNTAISPLIPSVMSVHPPVQHRPRNGSMPTQVSRPPSALGDGSIPPRAPSRSAETDMGSLAYHTPLRSGNGNLNNLYNGSVTNSGSSTNSSNNRKPTSQTSPLLTSQSTLSFNTRPSSPFEFGLSVSTNSNEPGLLSTTSTNNDGDKVSKPLPIGHPPLPSHNTVNRMRTARALNIGNSGSNPNVSPMSYTGSLSILSSLASTVGRDSVSSSSSSLPVTPNSTSFFSSHSPMSQAGTGSQPNSAGSSLSSSSRRYGEDEGSRPRSASNPLQPLTLLQSLPSSSQSSFYYQHPSRVTQHKVQSHERNGSVLSGHQTAPSSQATSPSDKSQSVPFIHPVITYE